jgi:queuine tRNA-ribosyltransferase/7-cyano-7-deazaguanine tRNA-ribosyltransferase
MFSFRITKKSSKSRARCGVIRTAHGDIHTPCLVTVATQGTIKALPPAMAKPAGVGPIIANTLHLHLRPGEDVVKKAGGLHGFMGWTGPIMTDSGGFQVFSLGFGRDQGVGKIGKGGEDRCVRKGHQPKLTKIGEDGVWFTSYIDGRKVFMGPRESMRAQAALGADIVFAFDECTPPTADEEYTRLSMEKTHRWAKLCVRHRGRRQALYGVVQGGRFEHLRRASARFMAGLPVQGFGIGGEFGDDKGAMAEMIGWTVDELPESKPRHLLGIGRPDDFEPVIKAGVDTFDCTVPTHFARTGTAFTSEGRLNIAGAKFRLDRGPLDRACGCFVCADHSRSYLSHLFRAKEILGATLLTFHNLHYFHAEVAKLRAAIRRGDL